MHQDHKVSKPMLINLLDEYAKNTVPLRLLPPEIPREFQIRRCPVYLITALRNFRACILVPSGMGLCGEIFWFQHKKLTHNRTLFLLPRDMGLITVYTTFICLLSSLVFCALSSYSPTTRTNRLISDEKCW